jgi:hypothetical protein
MNSLRKARLQRNGWTVADTAEFLDLSPQQAQFVELKTGTGRWGPATAGATWRDSSRPGGAVAFEPIACCQDGSGGPVSDRRHDDAVAAVIGATPGEIAKLIKRVETRRAA